MRRSVFGKTLWEQRRSLLAWTIGITLVGAFYAAFYPMINSPDIASVMETMAPELMEALGFTAIATPQGYLGSTTFGLLGPILTIIFGAFMGIRAIAGEEDAGRLDLLLAHPVARWRVVWERFAALGVSMLVVALVLFVALMAISGPAEFGEIGAANLAAAAIHLAVLGTFFGGLALAVGAASGSRSLAIAVIAIVGVVAYFGNTLATQVEGIAWLRDISPFHWYSGGSPLSNGLQAVDLGVLLAVVLVLVLGGTALFSRRDVAV